jgi:hypothetical protein
MDILGLVLPEGVTLPESFSQEYKCIFPFYFKGILYTQCALIEQAGFVYPVFQCPIFNITTKKDGINDYGDLNLLQQPIATISELAVLSIWTSDSLNSTSFASEVTFTGYCFDNQTYNPDNEEWPPLNPTLECDNRVPPFTTCKSDCPGGG